MDQIEIHWVWWLIAAVALGIVEILTLDLVLLMLAVGAFAALIASLLNGDVTVQVLTFCVTSVFLLLVLRPYLLRNLRSRTPLVETNAAAYVGRQAVTTTEVTERSGRVKLAGEEWSARTVAPGTVFAPDASVRVLRIEGATAVVGPIEAQDVHDPPDMPTPPPQTEIPEDRS